MKDLINKDNYLWYFFEYLEGNLTDEEKQQVQKFLILNPQLQREFDLIYLTYVRNDNEIKFPEKEILKHYGDSINWDTHSYDILCLKYIEGEFNEEDEKLIEKEINVNNELKKCLDLYKATKLKPDLKIKFKEKSILKKSRRPSITIAKTAIILSAAASIMLFIFLKTINKLLNYNNSINIRNEYAIKERKDEYKSWENNKNIEKLTQSNTKSKNIRDLKVLKIADQVNNNNYVIDENERLTYIEIEKIDPKEINRIEVNTDLNNIISLIDNIKNLNLNKNNKRIDLDKISMFNQIINKKLNINEIRKNINSMSLLNLGIKGINLLTEAEIKFNIDTLYDENVLKMKIESRSFAFMTTKKLE